MSFSKENHGGPSTYNRFYVKKAEKRQKVWKITKKTLPRQHFFVPLTSSKVLSLERTKKINFSFGSLLAFSYL